MKCCQANLIQDVAFEKAKESVRSQAPPLMLPAPPEQGIRISTKCKSLEVEEEVDLAVSPKVPKLLAGSSLRLQLRSLLPRNLRSSR